MAEELSPAREPEMVEVPARKPRRRKSPVEPSGIDAEAITASPRRRRSGRAQGGEGIEDPTTVRDDAPEEAAFIAAEIVSEVEPLMPALDLEIFEPAGFGPQNEQAEIAAALPFAVEIAAEESWPIEEAAAPAQPDPLIEPAAEDAAPDALFDPGEALLPDPAEPAPDAEEWDLPVVFADDVFPQDQPPALEEPAGTDGAAPDRAEQEDMAMPEPMMPDIEFGDGRCQPTVSAAREAPAEPPVLELEPLMPPPDNSPPLVARSAAAPAAEAPARDEPGIAVAPASKAWGPVHGAIDTALANLGPLLPLSRAAQLRRQVADAVQAQLGKIAILADSLVFARLPWLRRIGALVPRRRSTLIGGGLLVAAAGGGLGVRLLQPSVPMAVPAQVDSAAPLPSHVARRLGQELEMPVVPLSKGTLVLFATGADQLDSALALSRREAAGDGIVISLDALAAASRRVLAWYGLDTAVTVRPTPGPTLTFQGDVPDALYPLARAALANIGQLLGRDPILHTVQIRDQIGRSDTALLRAIFIGAPKSIVYTADGAREIGQPLYGGFAIKQIEPDSVVLAPAQPGSEITVTIPLREPSAATVQGPPLAALPDRSAVVLAQQSLPAKE